MQLKMFSIRDSKAEVYHPPFYKHSHGEAERDFKTLVNDGKSPISLYPDDYDLYHVGVYDDQTGCLKPLDTPLHIIKANALKN